MYSALGAKVERGTRFIESRLDDLRQAKLIQISVKKNHIVSFIPDKVLDKNLFVILHKQSMRLCFNLELFLPITNCT